MAETAVVAKHLLLAKFKEDLSPAAIDELIQGYASLVSLVPSLKTFHWGKDVSVENLHQGFTHVFETTFESVEGISEYLAHPAHVEFADIFLPALEKIIIIDYKPTTA
ncbi:stress-response A/B barrel domain-containing protein HS1-like [Zingiber officinale]|uniref:stress-response A/B barrel domain-containing protein HS1-like n=1 Tax=Zingiber officinale TaxID=94328 RepID=UPI001C4AFEC2|nr:stress-response A/B barrel domain-containing protein HS1-like [Zingiber officinale]